MDFSHTHRRLGDPGHMVPYEGRGAKLGIQELYRTDSNGRWIELDRNRFSIDDVNSNISESAIVARYEGGTSPTDLHSITVHSPYIINFLARVFADYPEVYTCLKHVEFVKPFHQFYHQWQPFVDAVEQETSAEEHSHVKLLHDLIGEVIRPIKVEAEDLLANGLIDFKHVWVLFPPTTEVFFHSNGYDQLGRVAKDFYANELQYALECDCIDCDGIGFGYVPQIISIGLYSDLKPIHDLDCIPVSMHPDKELRQRLSARGCKFEKLNGVHYRSFSGAAKVDPNKKGYPEEVSFQNARIIIDPAYYFSEPRGISNSVFSRRQVLHKAPRTKTQTQTFFESRDSELFGNDYGYGYGHTQKPNAKARNQPVNTGELDESLEEPIKSLSEDEYALCAPTVKGYSMTHKAWGVFPVDGVGEIEWSDAALERLVLQDDYKKIILAFVQAQLSNKDDFDDVIQGKGCGVIMLFQGPAGVGKTLTAESVAERMKCPLYALSSGELGDTATDVERNLEAVLKHCTRWKAVLLLDECDVFLEKRSSANMAQNKLVAIFLRLLEYYQGCLMLTTNRVKDIDPAFESRIHLTIEYPSLNPDSRYQIWWNFLHDSARVQSNQPGSSIAENDVRNLAMRDLNGRQIKNVVKTARLLAARDEVTLNIEHIDTVLRANGALVRSKVKSDATRVPHRRGGGRRSLYK